MATFAGLWQINAQVPGVPSGDVRVTMRPGGETLAALVLRAAR